MKKIEKNNVVDFWYGRINKHPEDATREEIWRLMVDFANECRNTESVTNLVWDLAAWSRKYPRDKIYSMHGTMDAELIELEERAKKLLPSRGGIVNI